MPDQGLILFPYPQVKTWFEVDALDDSLLALKWLATKRCEPIFSILWISSFACAHWHNVFYDKTVIYFGRTLNSSLLVRGQISLSLNFLT